MSSHPYPSRVLVLLREGESDLGLGALRRAAGIRAACSLDFPGCAVREGDWGDADAVVYDKLGVALVEADVDRLGALQAAAASHEGAVLAVEPERRVHAYVDDAASEAKPPLALAPVGGEKEATWGLQVARVTASKLGGKGVKVAVLDTGLDLTHPDFPGRSVTTHSFVKGQEVQDGHGHGTHTIGTSCGPKKPFRPPRYGVAHEAQIWAGKVLDNGGGGGDAGILAGINWAVTGGCRVVSMSLGAPVEPGQAHSRVFETVAKRAMKRGTLIVAAAGNESERQLGEFAPVGHPANCPSILAVAALDSSLRVGFFSNRGMDEKGGQIDVAAPGVDVYSSYLMPDRYMRLSGTSMACPHVAGIAALWAEAEPDATAAGLWTLLMQHARRLPLLSSDVGSGLVQAP